MPSLATAMKALGLRDVHVAEARLLVSLASPVSLAYLCSFAMHLVLLLVIGHTGAERLAAAALAHMFANASGNAVVVGTASAVDTLASQAFGARNYSRVGVITQRGIAILLLISAVVLVVWYNAGIVLRNLGQDAETAELAAVYVRWLMWGLPATAVFEVMKKHIQSIGIVTPVLFAAILGVASNALVGYVLVFHSPLGFNGAAITNSISQWAMALFLVVYFRYHRVLNAAARSMRRALGIKDRPPRPRAAAPDATAAPTGPVDYSSMGPMWLEEWWVTGSHGGAAVGAAEAVTHARSNRFPTAQLEAAMGVASSSSEDAVSVTPAAVSAGLPSVTAAAPAAAAAVAVQATPAPAAGDDAWHDRARLADDGAAAVDVGSLVDGSAADTTAHGGGDAAAAPAAAGTAPVAPAGGASGMDTDDIDAVLDATWAGINRRDALSGWREFIGLGLPSASMLLVEWGAFEAAAVISGLVSVPSLAAHTVIATTAGLNFMVPLGISVAASIRVGQLMGERKPKEAAVTYRVTLLATTVYFVLNAMVVGALHSAWGHLFTDDADVLTLLSSWLPLLAIYTPFDALQCACSGVLRGVGRPGIAAIANVIAYIVIGLPLSYLFAIKLETGLPGVWGGFIFAVFAAFLGLYIPLNVISWDKAAAKAHARAIQGMGSAGGGH